MKMTKLLVLAATTGLFALSASAAPPAAKGPAAKGPAAAAKGLKGKFKKGNPLWLAEKLEKAKALDAAKLKELQGLLAKVRECAKAAKAAGKLPRVECRSARRPFVRAQHEAYKAALGKAAGKLKASVEKAVKFMEARRARIKAKMEAKKAAAGKPAAVKK